MPKTQTETKFHPTMRRKVLAAADTQIQQVRVIGSKGQERNLAVYRCGPDIFYAETMDGLFDANRRRVAPSWLVEQLTELSEDRQFDCFGNAKSGGNMTEAKMRPQGTPAAKAAAAEKAKSRPADLDDDAPSFQGA